MQNYEVRPRRDKRGVDLISDALPFGNLWYSGPVSFFPHSARSSFSLCAPSLTFGFRTSDTADASPAVAHVPCTPWRMPW
jgi:hypothetical protein